MTEDQVYVHLEMAVRKAGGASLLAAHWRLSPQFICDVRKRRRALTNTMLDRLGIEKITTYRQVIEP